METNNCKGLNSTFKNIIICNFFISNIDYSWLHRMYSLQGPRHQLEQIKGLNKLEFEASVHVQFHFVFIRILFKKKDLHKNLRLILNIGSIENFLEFWTLLKITSKKHNSNPTFFKEKIGSD